MKRFELWLAYLPTMKKSDSKDECRPVIIISDDDPCESTSNVTIVPVTRNLTSPQRSTHVLLNRCCLDRPGRALCEQVMLLNRSRLVCRIGCVEDSFERFSINHALAAHLGLTQAIYIQEDTIYGTPRTV